MKREKTVKQQERSLREEETATSERCSDEKETAATAAKEKNVVMKDAVKLPIKVTKDIAKAVINEAEDLDADFATDLRHMMEELVVHGEEEEEEWRGKLVTTKDVENDGLLFDLLADALFGAVAAYAIADVRILAREHRDQMEGDPHLVQKLLQLPITNEELLEITASNIHKIAKQGTPAAELYRSAVEAYSKHWMTKKQTKTGANKQSTMHDNEPGTTSPRGPTTSSIYESISSVGGLIPTLIVVFDDENSSEELVYFIEVDRTKRMINVNFRGSVTIRDWLADASTIMTMVPNPLLLIDKDDSAGGRRIRKGKRLGIHSGFYDYLCGTNRKAASGSKSSKFNTILEHLRSLLQRYDGYSIRAAGHSLGGALATLFSFFLALEDDDSIHKPVKCVTFASPRVGNTEFSRAFQELEANGQLFCVRVANQNDVVTVVPDGLTCCTFCYQHVIYRHVGIELRLYGETKRNPDRRHRFRFKGIHHSRTRLLAVDLSRSVGHTGEKLVKIPYGLCAEDFLARHSCREYMERLEHAGKKLQEVTVDNIKARYGKSINEEAGGIFFR